jgi:predicted helicase
MARKMKAMQVVKNSKSWDEFKEGLEPLGSKEKGDAFELLTKYFLILNPTYATKLRHVWLYNEIPQKKRKHLGLPDRDQGIDLVAETKEGEFWAIQCKYREDEEKTLTWREVSTFAGLSFSVCRHISFGLICTTSERFTKVLKKQDNIGFCTSEVWRSLDDEFFHRLHSLISHRIELPKPYKPRKHQVRAIKSAVKHYGKEEEARGKLIMPCGTGKSLTAYWIAEELKAKTILIAVPSLSLIRQMLEVWLRESIAKGRKVDWICVCSDTTVGKIDKDEILMHTQDLGIPCVTDIEEIKMWYKKSPRQSQKIIFTTYQSGRVIAKASRKLKIEYDIGIMDEAHKTVGQAGKLFNHLLNDKNVSIKRRLFMTATERRYLGKSDEIVSMDDPKIYGETFELLSFKEALDAEQGILSDYKIITMYVTKSELSEHIKKNIFVKPDRGEWNEEVEAEMLASVIALRKAMKRYPIRHAVSFHRSIKRAELFKENQDVFSENFEGYGKLDTYHVSGILPTGVRQRIVNEFAKSDRGLITNARCLTEGVDVPNIDCVLFADPKRSTIDIVQAVGRALRPAKGKKYGYVIIPVLIEGEIDNAQIAESSAFSSILTILRALASNDERIVEYFRAISQGRSSKDGKIVDISIDEKVLKKINIDEFISAVQLKCWNKLAKLSWRSFEEARNYVHRLNLKCVAEWDKLCLGRLHEKGELPIDIPRRPNTVYKNKGWKNWPDWLGTETTAPQLRVFRPYIGAEKFVHKLKLRSFSEWRRYCCGESAKLPKRPLDIPANASRVYKNKGWESWGRWLGTNQVATRLIEYFSYNEAKKFAVKLKLKSRTQWCMYCKGKIPIKPRKPLNIPFAPNQVYKNKGWEDWGRFLGTNYKRVIKYRSFFRARKYVRKLGLKNVKEWMSFCKGKMPKKSRKPVDIPVNPQRTYKNKGWLNWIDWLGTEKHRKSS